jgi:hypothetical protein
MSRPSIELLPPELLAHVFDNLAKYCRAIQNVRLVCKVFRDLCSHHLITRVVVAERQGSLDRTRWIMDHKFIRKHVTHAVWDVSQFQESLAYDPRLYKKAWAHSPGSWSTPELLRSWREDRVSLAEMLRYEPREEPGPLPGDDCLEWADDVSEFADEVDYEHARNVVGFSDYHHRCNIQRCIHDRKLTWRSLLFATNRLPNLRHIEYTYLRALSLQGESYQALCQRLFPQTLHPKHMCHNSLGTEMEEKDHVAEQHGRQSLDDFLKYVSTLKWKPDSFFIGRNNFDLPELDRRDLWDGGVTVNSPDLDMIKSLTRETVHWFTALKSLHLPITSKPTPNSRSLPNDFSYTGVRYNSVLKRSPKYLSDFAYHREQWEEKPVHPYG